MESLEKEVKARKILLSALDQADRFYRNQRRDVKKVVYVSLQNIWRSHVLTFCHFRLTRTSATELKQYKVS